MQKIESNPRSHDKTVSRLSMILTKLENDERPTKHELAEEFNVSLRTIQRDVAERLLFFPIEKTNSGNLYFIEGFSLNRTSFEELEMILLSLSLSTMMNLGPKFKKSAQGLLGKLLLPDFSSAYMIKQDPHEPLDIDSSKMNDLEFTIKEKRITNITIDGLVYKVEPYKIVSFDEIWYLFAKDIKTDEIKTYFVSDITSVDYSVNIFKLKDSMDEVLKNVHSSWFKDGVQFEVKVRVMEPIAHYFKRKKHFASQNIKKENNDGSLMVTFDVSSDEEVDNLIKSWLPHIEVISPLRIRNKITKELNQYMLDLKDTDKLDS